VRHPQQPAREVRLRGWYETWSEGITVGRAPDNDLVLDSPEIRPHHARITRRGHHHFLELLDAAAGASVPVRISGIGDPEPLTFGPFVIELGTRR